MTEQYVDTVFAPDGRPELTTSLPTATTHVSLGFDQWGNQVASLGTIGDGDPDLQGTPLEHVRVVGATHQELDAGWQPLPVDPEDPETTAPPPLPDLNQMPTLVPYFEGLPMQSAWYGRAAGALAGHAEVPVAALQPVPDGVTLETLAPGHVIATTARSTLIAGTPVRVVDREERRLVGERWELVAQATRVERDVGGGRHVSRYTARYAQITVQRNVAREAIRALALGDVQHVAATQATRVLEAPQLDCQPTRASATNPLYSPPVCPPPEMEPPPPPPTPEFENRPTDGLGECGLSQVAPTHVSGTRPGILFVHGIESSACTWHVVADTVRRTLAVPALVAGSTDSRAAYDVQAAQAAAFPLLSSHGSFVAVGHSNGGIVSRIALQQGRPRLAGVVAIDSPHRGAGPALLELRHAWDSPALIAMGILSVNPGTPITMGNLLADIAMRMPLSRARAVWRIFDAADGIRFGGSGDVLPEMAPSSGRLSMLNAASETFPRAAIWSVAPERMLAFRLWGEMSAGGDPRAGDRSVARWERRKRRWRRWGWIGVAAGVVSVNPGLIGGGVVLHAGAAAVGQVNRIWPVAVREGAPGPDLRSDGVVTASSQQYPGVPAERLYFANGPTHFGSIRRTESLLQVRRAVVRISTIRCKDEDVEGCQ